MAGFIPKVKICGVTTIEDALIAIGLGADGLGFLVHLKYPSEDQLSPDKAAEIISKLPPLVSSVLVTHATSLADVVDVCSISKPSTVQLHGDFPLSEIKQLRTLIPGMKIIKAVHVVSSDSINQALEVAEYGVDAVLLDTKTTTRLGGTGITHDWAISSKICEELAPRGMPVILAGGLKSENIKKAIQEVKPFGVDVNTGVSEGRGVKSFERMKAFIESAKSEKIELHASSLAIVRRK